MVCPICSTENPDQAKFCSNCGESLTQICPNCSTENPLLANFCGNCGAALGAAKAPDKLQQYIPKELLKKLETARAGQTMAGERRVVTILFCDVKGSTAAAEQMDPEDWSEIMNGAFEHLIAPVYRYEGMLARLMGDAVLAFFGAPIAHEDDPERAVLAGLEIAKGIGPYRDQVRDRWGVDFDIRVGINTGLVVVGEVGSDLRMEYTAMGDAVNLAARMEQSAQPGSVLVAEETYRRVAPLFEFESRGPIEVKGKQHPVAAYRVLGRKVRPGRTRGIRGLEAPLIGRQSEMRALTESLHRLLDGRGGVVGLIGEAGLGKSRMIRELHAGLAGQGYWAESRGISYETTRPYGQFQQHIQRLYAIRDDDPPEEIRQKLVVGVAELDRPAEAASVLEALLAVEQRPGDSQLEGEQLRRQLYATQLAVWRGQAERSPTILVFDDLHWADSASTELLGHLFRLTDSVPILFLCALRPDRQTPAWRVKQLAEAEYPHRYRELSLQPLSADGSQQLVDSLLTVSELPPRLHSLIQEKSEGNPFFVEEVVRSLIDSGAVVRDPSGARWTADLAVDDIDIPDNLESLLVSRIDRLDGEVRRTLQLASVIGRHFYYRVLHSISEAVERVDDHLSALQRVELILEAARDPELEYAFRHALTQEAAYRSILRKERAAFHLEVGEALERLFAGRRTELAPLLAHHFRQADDRRGASYSLTAGDEAFRLYAIDDAVRHYRNALEDADPESLSHLYTRLGRSYELLARYEEALELYDAMATAARDRGDGDMQLIALTEKAKVYSIPNPQHNAELGRSYSDQAIELARALDNHESEARILWNRMNSEAFAGNVEQAAEFGQQSLETAERYDLREQLAFTLNDLTRPLHMIGKPEQALEAVQRARQLWIELENQPMLADNYMEEAQILHWLARLEEALEAAEQSARLAAAIDNLWGQMSGLVWSGNALYELGRFGPAEASLRRGLELAAEVGGDLAALYGSTVLGLLYRELGDPLRGLETLDVAESIPPDQYRHFRPGIHAVRAVLQLQNGDLAAAKQAAEASRANFIPHGALATADWVYLAQAEIALAERQPEQAVQRINELLDLTERSRRRTPLPEALLLRARAQRGLEAPEAARSDLLQAREQVEQTGAGRLAWHILLELSRTEDELGNREAALELRSAAGQAVTQLIEALDTPEQQAGFESRPEVLAARS